MELSCFFDDTVNVGNLISGISAFSKDSLNIWKFTVHILLKPGLVNFEYYFTSVWDECSSLCSSLSILWHCFSSPKETFIGSIEIYSHLLQLEGRSSWGSSLVQFSSVSQACPTLCNPMDCSMPLFPVHHQLHSLLKLMSIESVMPSNHLILCHPLLFPPSIFPSIRVFSNESVLRIRWPKYWSFSFSISHSNEYSRLISFRMDWLDLLVRLSLRSLQKHQFFGTQLSL